MISLTAKASRALRAGKSASFWLLKTVSVSPPKAAPLPFIRQFSSFSANPVALEMINYATSLARDQKTGDSYARGLLILEQCEANQLDDNSKGLVDLARSSLLFERGSHEVAIETLQNIQTSSLPSIAIKVAASEALAGIHLEFNQEDAASVAADLTLQILGTGGQEISDVSSFEILEFRGKAIKGLIELIHGNLDSAQSFFERWPETSVLAGNAALTYGEYLHGMRKFSTAKEMYREIIQQLSEVKDFSDPCHFGACNMISGEVAIAAACALGQLEAHMGNFDDAEEILTAALKKMENRFGSHHPKVGIVLTCIALMYQLKAAIERSSSLLVQEGLFRRAIELLRAPPFDAESASENLHRRDIIALARGGYAETLCVQQTRKAEGEKMKKWAETAWKNRWMSLQEALEQSESSPKVPVIDTRTCRAL